MDLKANKQGERYRILELGDGARDDRHVAVSIHACQSRQDNAIHFSSTNRIQVDSELMNKAQGGWQ